MNSEKVIQFDKPHKVHTSYIWLGAIRTFLLIFSILIASAPSIIPSIISILKAPNIDLIITFSLPLILVCIFVAVFVSYLIALIYHFFSYRFISYTISKDQISIKRGIFFKKNQHIPFARIQTIDLSSSFLQRIVGVSDVSIDTAGGSKNARVKIPYVKQTTAEVLRLLVYSLKKVALNEATFEDLEKAIPNFESYLSAPKDKSKSANNIMDFADNIMSEMGSIAGGSGIADEKCDTKIGISNTELFLSAISGTHTLVCLGLILFSVIVAIVLQNYIPIRSYSGEDVVIAWFSNYISNSFAIIMSLIASVTIVICWISITLTDAFNNAGFECRRKGSRLEVEHGLFQHSTQSVDIDKIQEIKVKQGLLRQIIGYASISALTITSNAGGSAEEKKRKTSGVLLHPFIKLKKVESVIAEVLPEFEFRLIKTNKVAPVALRRSIIRNTIIKNCGFWCLIAYFVFLLILKRVVDSTIYTQVGQQLDIVSFFTIIICVVIVILGFINAIMWFKSSCYENSKTFIQITRGGLHRTFVSIPRNRVQWIYTSINPFQKSANTVTLNVRSAAGSGGTTTRLIDLKSQDAEKVLAWVKPRNRE